MILNSTIREVPTGFKKLISFHWSSFILLYLLAFIGLAMLYSIDVTSKESWMRPQMFRLIIGSAFMLFLALTPIVVWRNLVPFIYIASLISLVYVLFGGVTVNGATRWIEVAGMRLQPSEFVKPIVVLMIAFYYHYLPPRLVSRPLYLIPPIIITLIPAILTLVEPDLGTAIFIVALGALTMLAAGVDLRYYLAGLLVGGAAVLFVVKSEGTSYQILKNYQYARINTFLDPESDPSGNGYNIIQSKIALGSGGLEGRGFLEGTQSRLDFLPESHTDFIFTVYAESFGFIGSTFLLAIYLALSLVILHASTKMTDTFSRVLTTGASIMFSLFFLINIAMVMGVLPVVGVPLPMISYGGSVLLTCLLFIGIFQSAYVHRARRF